ncbi:MAG: threonylcarbamoyl-AMP synthase [Phycisphaerae bacterium]|nr:threonylcarbamoyl-AMP synthase [Phycisphaerae bacterium]
MITEIIRVDPLNIDSGKIRAAAAVVDGGGLVAFPTETVYGIACRAEESALARLDEAKGRPADKRYSLHIAKIESITDYIPRLSFRACKLIENCWPGPVTIVFELSEADLAEQKKRVSAELFDILYQGGTLGVRCPDSPVAIALLGACKWPVVAPSANLSGQEPALTAKMVIDQLDGRVDMVIDSDGNSGDCRYQINSTVVKVSSGNITILREGAVKIGEIEDMSLMRILFVCTGNTCRSPMGEYFCKKYIAEKLECNVDELEKKGYKISSAGVFGIDGAPASSEVVDICKQKGIDSSLHRSRFLTVEMIEDGDIIFAMTGGHVDGVLEMYPEAESKCFLLDGDKDIPDPIGGGFDVYNECARIIERALDNRLCEMMI